MALPWRRALVVGASSGMGAEMARRLGAAGCAVALVARRPAELHSLEQEITAAGPGRARAYVHDVTCYDQVPALFQQICRDLEGLDLVVYAAGVMPAVADDEYSFDKDLAMVQVNLLGAIAWINEAADRFGKAGAGTIVGISSVAGDRGRRGLPVYGATKAALATYLEALRNRVARKGVAVVVAKPGPVRTPMTEGLHKMPMAIDAPLAARLILDGAARGKGIVYVPGKWRPVMFVLRHVPSWIFRKLNV